MSELDERRVLDAIYGDSEHPRWHYVVSDKDFEEFELPMADRSKGDWIDRCKSERSEEE